MTLAYLTINLDAFTGDDHPPVPSYSTITLDPGADHIDAANDVIHVRSIVVSLDRQGKAATANGVPCVDGKVPVVVGVAYAVSAPNVLRGGPHYIPALTAGQVVDLSDYITPGAPLTPDQAAILTARIEALETTPPDHGALTGLGDDDHTQYALADGTRGAFAAPLGADDNYVTDAEKAALHAHSNKAALDLVSGTNTGDQVLPTWSTIAGKPAVVAAGATQADARTAIGAGTSSLVIGTGAGDAKAGNYQPTAANISDSTTTGRALLTAVDAAAARTSLGLGTAATTASTAYATAAQGTTADGAAQKSANLSDLANAGTARTNLGLGDSAVVGALPIPDPGAFYPTDTLTAALQLIGGREQYGTGSPEGVIAAPVGTYYTDTTLASGALHWAKMSGAGNTGWAPTESVVTHPNGTDVLVRRWDIGQARWQRIYYDSGLRQIPYTSGTANWTAGNLYLRRQNDVVTLWMTGVKMAAIGSKIYDLPAAFTPGNYAEPIGAIFREETATGNPYWFTVTAAEVCRRGAALAGSFLASYTFSGAWTYQTNLGAGVPATLPGALVTAAPPA